jgi:hypothetical protein
VLIIKYFVRKKLKPIKQKKKIQKVHKCQKNRRVVNNVQSRNSENTNTNKTHHRNLKIDGHHGPHIHKRKQTGDEHMCL